LLTFGTGIGGGVFIEGKMLYGKSDGACEIGHMTIHPGGKPCNCGNRGCFEEYCSGTAIGRRGSEAFNQKIEALRVFQCFESGDLWARKVLEDVSTDLAIALASLTNIFDPELIVLGGGIFSSGGGPLIPWTIERMHGRCFESLMQGLEIKASALDGEAGVLGAASLHFENQSGL